MKVALSPACFPGGGGGHVVRCLALARALEAEGAECAFVLEPLGAELLGRLGWTGDSIAASDPADRIGVLSMQDADAFVVDDYRLGALFEAALPGPVLTIDDVADRTHDCALLVDAGYGRRPSDYTALAPHARLLLGPDYALLRKGFSSSGRNVSAEVLRVFVCFGLADPGGITERAVRLLRPLAPGAIFDIALGPDAPSLPTLRRIAEDDPGLAVHVDADTAPLMHAADLGVGAGGGMVWERRAAGLPQLVVALAENQRPSARALAEDGAIALVDTEDASFETGLQTAFTRLLHPDVRRAQIDNPRGRCDGRGAHRVAKTLLDLVRIPDVGSC